MTNQQGAPEALRLRNYVERRKRAKQLDVNKVHAFDTGCDTEAELLLSDVETLLSLVEAQQPTTHVQNPAEIEHVAGDVSKNGAEVNTNVYAELPPSVGEYKYGGGLYTDAQMRVFADATHALRAQQPAPATQKLTEQICISDTNQSAACAVGSVGTTSDAQTTRSTHDAPATQQAREVSDAMVLAALQMQHPAAYGQYLRHPANGPKTSIRTEAEIDTARRMIAAALAAAPQPSPTPQADSQPAPVLDYPPLPRVGAIGYASVVDIDSYVTRLTIGPHLVGVRDVALWTTDQMRAYVDADRAARAPAESVLEDAARYRWLRRWKGQEHEPLFTVQHEMDGTLWGGDLDAAVDAARKQVGKP